MAAWLEKCVHYSFLSSTKWKESEQPLYWNQTKQHQHHPRKTKSRNNEAKWGGTVSFLCWCFMVYCFVVIFTYVTIVLPLSSLLSVAIKENIENEHIVYFLTATFRTMKSSLAESNGSVSHMAKWGDSLASGEIAGGTDASWELRSPEKKKKNFISFRSFDSSNRSVR